MKKTILVFTTVGALAAAGLIYGFTTKSKTASQGCCMPDGKTCVPYETCPKKGQADCPLIECSEEEQAACAAKGEKCCEGE